METEIRRMAVAEYPLLDEFLYQAIFVPKGADAPPREIINQPDLQIYVRNFGQQEGDYCLVCDCGGKVVGAVWVRIMDDYGHIDDETPSFAISILPEHRGRGIGTRLMKAMLELLKSEGFERASLAVQKENYAVKMYRSCGFETVSENEQEYIMVCKRR